MDFTHIQRRKRIFNTVFYLTLELLIHFDPFSIFVGIVLKLTPVDCVTNTFLGLRFIFKLKYEKSAIVVHVLQKR